VTCGVNYNGFLSTALERKGIELPIKLPIKMYEKALEPTG